MVERILVADDDPDIRVFLQVTLEVAGFEVLEAVDGRHALELAVEHHPDLILMDVMMPRMGGFEAVSALRTDGRISHIPVIMVTAKAQGADKVRGLGSGADDYVVKPFDPDELVARVRTTLRRAAEMRSVSPLTGLPGNARIQQELARRVEAGTEFALLYADVNHFKAYNDHYGFMHGDEVLKALAQVIVEAVARHGDEDTFVGHVGGDDFVVLTDPGRYRPIADEICRGFDREVPQHYRDEDLATGHIEVPDRRGNIERYGVVSVSIGVCTTGQRDFEHTSEVVEIATEMKAFAKQAAAGRSNWAVDRRRDANRSEPAQAPASETVAASPASSSEDDDYLSMFE